MYFTYVLRSAKTGQYYIGQSSDLTRRLHEHNSDQSSWTKGKGPWVLVYSKAFETRAEAVGLERQLKGYKNRTYLELWIRENG